MKRLQSNLVQDSRRLRYILGNNRERQRDKEDNMRGQQER